ncbi:nuclear transport factor 2 family protein [Marinicella sp. W31]|uniref:nuclear transport factor 2 family protein n=1 Tax=Marinicella sp. W31 TaxID=3023713 RepID=UPI0037567E80
MVRTYHHWVLWIVLTGASCVYAEIDTSDKKIQVTHQFIKAFNNQNVEQMLVLVSEDITWHYVSGAEVSTETVGKKALAESMRNYFSSCPSCRSKLIRIMATQERISAWEEASWEADSGRKKQTSLSVYEFKDDLIQRVYYFPTEK